MLVRTEPPEIRGNSPHSRTRARCFIKNVFIIINLQFTWFVYISDRASPWDFQHLYNFLYTFEMFASPMQNLYWLFNWRRGSVGGAAWLSWWCGVGQLVARRLAGRQARVRFPARHHREDFPTEPQAMMRWREASANVLYECDWIIVLYECYKI